MKRRVVVTGIVAGLILIGSIASATSGPQSSYSNKPQPVTCDGTAVTKNCTIDGASYSTYIYHPAIAEKSHTETITSYEEKVTGYCTLCNDGTYSPSCATGSGACSHHGGVAQWNAPRYSQVPVYSTKQVIDTPATDAYYEKVLQ